MTKKVSKKNLICLFPPKSGKGKQQQGDKVGPLPKLIFEKDDPQVPNRDSDWQEHYDYMETSPWGCGLFGTPMDAQTHTIALRAIELALQSADKEKIAKSYRHLFYFYNEFNHPDTLNAGLLSAEFAAAAYGPFSAELGEELAMLAVFYEFSNEICKAVEVRDKSIEIFQKVATTERLFEALELAICSAADHGRDDKVEEYARLGIQLVKERCQKESREYSEYMEYFQEMLETAHEPPVQNEVKHSQLLSLVNVIKGVMNKV